RARARRGAGARLAGRSAGGGATGAPARALAYACPAQGARRLCLGASGRNERAQLSRAGGALATVRRARVGRRAARGAGRRSGGAAVSLGGIIDSHCHLDFEAYAGELDDVLARARAAGVVGMVTIGSGRSVASARAAVVLAEREPDIWATVGVH